MIPLGIQIVVSRHLQDDRFPFHRIRRREEGPLTAAFRRLLQANVSHGVSLFSPWIDDGADATISPVFLRDLRGRVFCTPYGAMLISQAVPARRELL